MASPPFNIAETSPGDSDIASQFPALERTFRDVVESWLLVEGNTNGRSNKRAFDWVAAPSGVASVTTLYAATDGNLMTILGAGSAQGLIPAGVVVDFAGSVEPDGWLFPYGQAVSRTTYARLFTALGTTYGAGDGSTTFNLPDYRGRVGIGKDNMGGSAAGRVTATYFGTAATTLGNVGGSESHTLTTAQLAAHSHGVTDPGHTHVDQNNSWNASQMTPGGSNVLSTTPVSGSIQSATTGITINNAGGGGAHNNMPPGIIVNKLIKT